MSKKQTDKIKFFIDGACKGNPGPAGVGVVVQQAGKVIKEISESIGEATNNIAEYSALIYAMKEAKAMGLKQMHVTTDSELLYKQMTGQYQVKNAKLIDLFDQVHGLAGGFDQLEIVHVLRDKNKLADELATQSLKKHVRVVAPLFKSSEEESPSSKG
jgi:ribonuclease HI